MQDASSKLNPSDIFDAIPGGFFIYYAHGNEELIYANTQLLMIFGCETLEELRELTHNSFKGLVHPEDLEEVEESILEQINSNQRSLDYVEYRIIRKDGEVRWLEDFGHLIHNEALGDIFYVFVSDITERKEQMLDAVRKAEHIARERDQLTGLYTKEFFYRYAEQIMAIHPEKKYAILTTDIENFKFINESYGIETGNRLLKQIATNSAKHIPGYTIGGRVDGDSFVALLELVQPSEQIIETICSIRDKSIVPNLSIKHGFYDLNEDIPVDVMCNRAFLALNNIKGTYGKRLQKYDDTLRIDWIKKQQIMDSAEDSLHKGLFLVYYQPKHDLRTNKTGGAEALVRWTHPDYGFMNPGMFIPMFEENGFIKHMDAYIREETCRMLSECKEKGYPLIPVSVNISRRDFEEEDFVESIIALTEKYGLEHSLLHLEVTESCYVDNPEKIARDISLLHQAGFIIELDDFGAGYSSLASLNAMPLDTMKVDMSIIRKDVPGSERNVLEFIMQLAKMMHLQTVQEGVETEEQYLRMKSLGCDFIQGFYFSKPLPKADYLEYIMKEI